MTASVTPLRPHMRPVHAGPHRHAEAATFAALDALTGPLEGMVAALADITREADLQLQALAVLDAAVDILRTELGARREQADIAVGKVARCAQCGDVLWPQDMPEHEREAHG